MALLSQVVNNIFALRWPSGYLRLLKPLRRAAHLVLGAPLGLIAGAVRFLSKSLVTFEVSFGSATLLVAQLSLSLFRILGCLEAFLVLIF